jgi:hypothetical protein
MFSSLYVSNIKGKSLAVHLAPESTKPNSEKKKKKSSSSRFSCVCNQHPLINGIHHESDPHELRPSNLIHIVLSRADGNQLRREPPAASEMRVNNSFFSRSDRIFLTTFSFLLFEFKFFPFVFRRAWRGDKKRKNYFLRFN